MDGQVYDATYERLDLDVAGWKELILQEAAAFQQEKAAALQAAESIPQDQAAAYYAAQLAEQQQPPQDGAAAQTGTSPFEEDLAALAGMDLQLDDLQLAGLGFLPPPNTAEQFPDVPLALMTPSAQQTFVAYQQSLVQQQAAPAEAGMLASIDAQLAELRQQ